MQRLTEAFAQEEAAFRAASPASAREYETALAYLPGGTTRQAVYYEPYPLTIAGGEGAYVIDVDGRRFLNLVGEYTAGVYGNDRDHLRGIFSRIERTGLLLGGPTVYEGLLAELICSRFPSCDMVRFCNSGTEANLFAILLARRATGRAGLLAFEGAYHGGVLNFDGNAQLNVPFETILAPYNDIDPARELIRTNAHMLAAVVVEPLMGAGGCIPGHQEFLKMLRLETETAGICLIFDEVMTSRLSPGGLQSFYTIKPDLTAFGKYMGGGFSFGAFGGRNELMAKLDPRIPGFFAHSGTFNNNSASMISGYYSLKDKYNQEANIDLNRRGNVLRESLRNIALNAGAPIQVIGLGGVMNVHFQAGEIVRPADLGAEGALAKALFHLWMINRGIYLAPRGMISLSMEVSANDIDKFLLLFKEFTTQYCWWTSDGVSS